MGRIGELASWGFHRSRDLPSLAKPSAMIKLVRTILCYRNKTSSQRTPQLVKLLHSPCSSQSLLVNSSLFSGVVIIPASAISSNGFGLRC